MDADVALGDEHKAGEAVVLGLLPRVSVHLGRGDLGHADGVRVLVQEAKECVGVLHHLHISPIAIHDKMHPAPSQIS